MPVFINNVDDYLGPSQACVNPLFAAPPESTPSTDVNVLHQNEEKTLSSNGANGSVSTSGVVHGRRRIRQRRVPQIIRSDDSESESTSNVGEAVRLANDDTYMQDIQQSPTPTISTITTTTTTQIIKKKAKASVTLSDCLSCSGCVTSAEAVLMSHHSIDTLREVARSRNQTRKRIVFTISSASLADIYRHLYLESGKGSQLSEIDSNGVGLNAIPDTNDNNPSRHEFLSKIASFLHYEFDAEMVIDGALAQRISLEESAAEFCYRYKQTQQRRSASCHEDIPRPTLPSIALSSTKTRYINKQPEGDGAMDIDAVMEVTTLCHPPGRSIEEYNNVEAIPASNKIVPSPSIQSCALPMLSSSCPGFVCLVEKTAPLVVPLLTSAKSPMAVAGTLLKTGQWKDNFTNSRRDVATSDDASEEDIASSWYHVAIMPCHDKKLEAGRGDFAWERQALLQFGNSMGSINKGIAQVTRISTDNEVEDIVNEVDLVLTTGEILEILNDAVAKLSRVGPTASLAPQLPSATDGHSDVTVSAVRNLLSRTNLSHGMCMLKTIEKGNGYIIGSDVIDNFELDTGVHGSGSYADFIFRYAAHALFGCKLAPNQPLPWKSSCSTSAATTSTSGLVRRRSRRQETTDLREVTLYENSDGLFSYFDDENGDSGRSYRPVLRFATAYGFKNVQLMLQSLSKTEATKCYDYVEIMACPSGCSNGGGQIGANGHRETPRETKERVRRTVSTVPIVRPTNTHECGSYASRICGCNSSEIFHASFLDRECFDDTSRQLFHTHFHVVPKLELSTGATAGVALSDTKW